MNSKDWEAKSLVGGYIPPIPPPGSATVCLLYSPSLKRSLECLGK